METFFAMRFFLTVVNFLLSCQAAFDIPDIPGINYPSPRGLLAESVRNDPIGSIPEFASSQQLVTLNISKKWSKDDYLQIIDSYMGFSLDVASIQKDSHVFPMIVAFGFAIVAGLLITIISLFFCCCRLCDKCGGRKPRKDEYPKREIALLALITFTFCVLYM
jgi:hypothetical protein